MNKPKFVTLGNGLTILIYSDKTKMTNHVELRTFLGATNLEYTDSEGNTKKIPEGTAHLLEHYICECNNHGNYIDNIYGNKALGVNASTNRYETRFYFDTVYNFKECLLTMLCAIYDIDFTKEKIDKTKYAVFNELRDEKDKPRRKIANMHSILSYGQKIDAGGTKTSVSSVTAPKLEEIYKTFYVPKNQFLVVAGTFDEEEIITLIENFYNKYTFKNNKRYEGISGTPRTYNKTLTIEGTKVDEVIMKYKIPLHNLSSFEMYKQDWYLAYFIEINLSDFSKLNEELKRDNIITGNISSSRYSINGYQIIEIGAYTNNKKEFVKRVHNLVNNPVDTEEEFKLNKKDSILHLSVRSDNISSYVIPTIDNYISFGYKENDTLEFVETLNYKEYKETIANIDFSKYSTLTIKDK